ncbi:MAG: DUF2238 domain-containing protein [Planctomycetota bacterium]
MLALTLALVTSLLDAPFPRDQVLQHLPMLVALPILLSAARRGWWSTASLVQVALFLFVHVVGARWVYSFVPYDEWSRSLLGWSPDRAFGLSRNHFDRFAHLASGVLLVLPFAELARTRGGLARGWSIAFGWCAVVALGAVYEVFEWLLTLVVHGEDAVRYNGQQGDAWDAQKDMALAALGGLVAVAVGLVRRGPREPDR